MTIDDQLAPLTTFLPLEELKEKLHLPMQLMPEPVAALVPSIVLAGDGPALERIALISQSYICDVQVSRTEFDFIDKSTVVNYRFTLAEHDIKDGDTVKGTFQVATIDLLHDLGGFSTQLSYAGHQRDAWLKQALGALPISVVLRPR